MSVAAGGLVARVTLYQVLLGAAVVVVLAAEAPELLRLSAEERRQFFGPLVLLGSTTEALSIAFARVRTGQLRYMLRALALGSPAFHRDDLTALARLPGAIAFRATGAALVVALLVTAPFVANERPDGIAVARVLAFAIFVIAAGALPLYTLVRGAVTRALEIAPFEIVGEVLARAVPGDAPRRRVLVHFAAAVALPLAVMAAGTSLVALARVREATDVARAEAATALARGTLFDAPGALPTAGRPDAFARAAELGFEAEVRDGTPQFSAERDARGDMIVVVPLSDTGYASLRVSPQALALASPAALLTAVAALVATGVWLGMALGRATADDLVMATRQVHILGSRAEAPPPTRPARFRVVAEIGQATATLAKRFRVFAEAQTRTIDARAAALRLRGLLFASVSHDLKTPLNAILGFCAIASAEPLNENQLESIRIIERRGRELLALLETILDAARVEAKRFKLVLAPCTVTLVLMQALRRGDDLGPSDAEPVTLTIADDLPVVHWDDVRIAQAIGFVLGHAKRLSPSGGVRLEARLRDADQVEITISEPSDVFDIPELARLLDASNAATAPRRLGGLALGLSLARSLAELHNGTLVLEPAAEGGIMFRFTLPLKAR